MAKSNHKNSKQKQKKKGPKGKKARAKAKLERQWGEQATTGTVTTLRRPGTSRLLLSSNKSSASLSQPQQQPPPKEASQPQPPQQQPEDSSDDDDENENACQSLLQSIRHGPSGTRRQRHGVDDDDDDDDDGSNDHGSSNPVQDKDQGSLYPVDPMHDVDDVDDAEQTRLVLSMDPFTRRFSSTTTTTAAVPFTANDNDDQDAAAVVALQTLPLADYHLYSHDNNNHTTDADDDDIEYDQLVVQVTPSLLHTLQSLVVTTQHDDDDQLLVPPTLHWPDLARAFLAQTRPVIQQQWKTALVNNNNNNNRQSYLNAQQRLLLPPCSSYADILWTCSSSSNDNHKHNHNQHAVEQLTALHVLQHVWTSRSRIQCSNRRIRQKQQQQQATTVVSDTALDKDIDIDNTTKEDDGMDEDTLLRDQGYTRPTVLILMPTRGVCHTFLRQYLIPLLGEAHAAVEHLERFDTEYGPPPVMMLDPNEDNNNNNNDNNAQAVLRHRRKVLQQKGRDWHDLFGDQVNDDDDFRMGLSLTPKGRANNTDSSKVAVKLFTDFYKSDIILASPLGLKITTATKQGDDGDDSDDNDDSGNADDNTPHVDFLSSIEICLLLRSDVLLMQNWDHVSDMLALLNQQPKNSKRTDFSRVRPYLLDGQAAQYRQLILVAPFLDPLFLSTFKRYAKSQAGQFRVRRRVTEEQASMTQVLLPTTRQVFQRVPCLSFATQSQDRLAYFCSTVLPQLQTPKPQKHTLIYIPSYFDFVSIRNVLLKQKLEFVSVTEYARGTEINRGRARFLQGRKPWMLYTGRAHFFHRHLIKGARHVIFFGLPEHAEFYPQHVNQLNEGLEQRHARHGVVDEDGNHGNGDHDDIFVDRSESCCLVLYTKYESHALERIVGSNNCSRMVKGEQSTFLFSA